MATKARDMTIPDDSPHHEAHRQSVDHAEHQLDSLEPTQHRRSVSRRSASLALLVVTAVGIAALIAVALTALTASDAYVAYGLPDPGAVVRYGLPLARVIAEAAALVCIGSLWLATFGVPAQPSGFVAADGYAALRTAGWAGTAWFGGAALVAPLLAADASGRPISDLADPIVLLGLIDAIEQAKSWLLTAGIALVVAIGCRLALTWKTAAVLMLLSLAALLPVIATGHSASGAHDVATSSMLYHLVGASLWIGGLIAVLAHAARGGAHLGLVARRFSGLALVCWIGMAASGVINAATRLTLPDLVTSDYGLLILVKVAALGALGFAGYRQRAQAVRAIAGRQGIGDLLRLGAIEVLLMSATVGVAVALGRTPPPAAAGEVPSRTEELIGYDLAGPPTVLRMLLDWRFDLIYGVLAVVLAALYLRAVWRLRRRGEGWPVMCTVAWLCGCAVVLLATSSGIGRYAPAVPSVQLASWLLLTVVAPALLMSAAPLSLAQRLAQRAEPAAPAGPVQWARVAGRTWLLRVLSYPLAASVLLVCLLVGVYFTGLLETGLYEFWLQPALKGSFLLVGCLLYWTTLAIDPVAGRARGHVRLLALAVASVGLAAFGLTLTRTSTVIGDSYYRGLGLGWMSDILAEQHLAGVYATIAAGVPLIMAVLTWTRGHRRTAH
ncbi:copper resistance protein CopD [Allosaccharopolyspora coralli]|uniref:Copper resistance protein CopD n=1 Tax=Allosaccharopolyspora coralli TaxID=2665642 RepID=A0A5Q3QHF9_9PSEU|nr:cytochrome c oxidase assembly protein [Allosaccharopolyspora coralli]QGK70267.1 copper resistance protein CopD [Allosaccharopolyspora coralli]